MKLEFGFGTGVQTVELPEKNLMGVLMANEVPKGLMNEEEVVRENVLGLGTHALGNHAVEVVLAQASG